MGLDLVGLILAVVDEHFNAADRVDDGLIHLRTGLVIGDDRDAGRRPVDAIADGTLRMFDAERRDHHPGQFEGSNERLESKERRIDERDREPRRGDDRCQSDLWVVRAVNRDLAFITPHQVKHR